MRVHICMMNLLYNTFLYYFWLPIVKCKSLNKTGGEPLVKVAAFSVGFKQELVY